MGNYAIEYWVGFFYLYSIQGWIWESCYVSLKKRKWINRGFLNGPLLPIYGCGAVLILIITKPLENEKWAIFLAGMAGATLLEYITGYGLEKIFKVRYWDYSTRPLNLHGHICPECSLCWGVFSLILRELVHPKIEVIVLDMPYHILLGIISIFSILFVTDCIVSVNEAVNLKKLIQTYNGQNERIQNLQKQISAISTIVEELKINTVDAFKEHELLQTKQELLELKKVFEEKKEKQKRKALRILKRNPGSTSKKIGNKMRDIEKYLNM